MLKADLANNDSNGVVGFILYPRLLLSLSFSYSFFRFPLRALQLQSDPEGMCHPRQSRQSFYDRRTAPYVGGHNCNSCHAGPQYYAPYAFYRFIYCVL